MSIKRLSFVLVFSLALLSITVHALPHHDAVDLWRTYDLKGQARSVLKFYVSNGELNADVVKILLYNGDRCTKCKGMLKNKPYMGMTIIQGLKYKNNKWIDGQVLDTDTGNTYSCNITISDDGKTMYFHAYKGLPLFGRTVNWHREVNQT